LEHGDAATVVLTLHKPSTWKRNAPKWLMEQSNWEAD
jgi:hypothetical protein